jgi:predicted nucleotidyltransferase
MEASIDSYLEAARRVCATYPEFECAFLSGSLLEGFGNASSDLDLYVVQEDERRGSRDAHQSYQQEDSAIDLHVDEEIRTLASGA